MIVVDEITKHLKTDLREFLYADDLVLGESWGEVPAAKYAAWKSALESKGLKVNVSKTKAMKLGGKKTIVDAERDSCAICGKRVMRNLIQCTQCMKWVHKRCTDVGGSLARCLKVNVDEVTSVRLGNDTVEVGERILLFGWRIVYRRGDVSSAVTGRIRLGWKKFKEVSGMLCAKHVHWNWKENCIRPVWGVFCVMVLNVGLWRRKLWKGYKEQRREWFGWCVGKPWWISTGVKSWENK